MKALSTVIGLLLAMASGCTAEVDGTGLDGDATGVVSVDLSGKPAKNTALKTNIEANMFQWAATNAPILRLIPRGSVVTVGNSTDRYGFYQVVHAGTWGWIHGSELDLHHGVISGLSRERQDALTLAQSAMGFSYWWSNAKWSTRGATYWPTDNAGICDGNCPDNCDHYRTGSVEYGADCSGFLSTVWGIPDSDPNTNPTNHGFMTERYAQANSRWTTIALSRTITGDAVVRHDKKRKHIFMVGAAPASGWVVTYECIGCVDGCRAHRRRTADLGLWHAIRQNRWPSN